MTALFGLDLSGRRVVVVGGGTVAARRVRRFLTEGADIVVVAPELCDDLARIECHSDVSWRARRVQRSDLAGAWFVLAATDDREVNDEVAAWANTERIWCIDASNAERGSARQAASSRHGGLLVGVVSTDGVDPARVRAVRAAVATHIDAGEVDLRRHRRGLGRVILVGAGPGDPGLITVRGRVALAEADVVVADRLGTTELLATVPHDVQVINVGKSPTHHPVPQHDINALLVTHARMGRTVVRLKGGDPFVFGRGGEEVHACIEADVAYEVVPGISSAMSVPALADIPLTQRGVASSFLVTSGHGGPSSEMIAAMSAGATVVILMGISELASIAGAALRAGVHPATPAAIIERGSTAQQRVTRSELGLLAGIAMETRVKPPAVIVIGTVAGAEILASRVSATPSLVGGLV